MNRHEFKQYIKEWPERRLSNSYQTYSKRIEETPNTQKKDELQFRINTIKEEWSQRKAKDSPIYFSSPAEGLLSTMGYRVGANGLKEKVRRRILKDVFTGPIPLVGNLGYMSEWGKDKSEQRKEKITRCLWAFSSGGLHKDHEEAVKDWKEDLEFFLEYYSDYTSK